MSTNETHVLRQLKQIKECLREARGPEADRRLEELIEELSEDSLRYFETDIRDVLNDDGFRVRKKKAYRRLSEHLDRRLKGEQAPVAGALVLSENSATDARRRALNELDRIFENMTLRHLFQWSQYESLGLPSVYEQLAACQFTDEAEEATTAELEERFMEHAFEIFSKGATHTHLKGASRDVILNKSASGFRDFVEVVLSARASAAIGSQSRQSKVAEYASASLAGIVKGFAAVQLNGGPVSYTGADVLSDRGPFLWGRAIGYMSLENVEEVAPTLAQSSISFQPLKVSLNAIRQQTHSKANASIAVAEVNVEQDAPDVWTLTQAVSVPTRDGNRTIRIKVALSSAPVPFEVVRTPINRGDCSLAVAHLNAETFQALRNNTPGYERICDAGGLDAMALERAKSILDTEIGNLTRASQKHLPLTRNFAEEFPLTRDDQVRTSRYLIKRIAVLDRTVNLGHGAYLWCSVRRSGKSTAAYYMTRAEGGIAWQSYRPEHDHEMVLKSKLDEAFKARKLPNDFVNGIVELAALNTRNELGKRVLVIDEYEQLFGELRTRAEDTQARQEVVIPFLNELLEFAQDNILIMTGLIPNAHFIVMDQNHLAPSLKVEAFPLFDMSRSSRASEFSNLVEVVLTPQVSVDQGFLNEVYAETNGHPYLTVELLRHFLDFQITQERKLGDLKFVAADFEEFRAERFSPRKFALVQPPTYAFHRNALRDAFQYRGRANLSASDRWILFASWVLREIANACAKELDPKKIRISHQELEDAVRDSLPELLDDYGLYDLLREAALANFVDYDDEFVWPAIPILARLAAAR